MAPSRPFFTPTGELDKTQLLVEAQFLAVLVGTVLAVALVPLLLQLLLVDLLGFLPFLGALLSLVVQFVLAVGAGVVLLYVIVRANQLSEE